ncbi:MAG: hypothetical protein WEB33_09445 [Bacteroidota bacterium]
MSFKLFEKFYDRHGKEGLTRFQRRLHERTPDGRRVTLDLLAEEFSCGPFHLSVASVSRLRETVFDQTWPLKASVEDFLRFKQGAAKWDMDEVRDLLEHQDEFRSRLLFIEGGKANAKPR